MKLRFSVNQAEAFRLGVDVPKSIVTIDVTPSDIKPRIRDIIADRLDGIDVCQLKMVNGKREKAYRENSDPNNGAWGEFVPDKPVLIQATLPTLEHLILAVQQDEVRINAEDRKNWETSNPSEVEMLNALVAGHWDRTIAKFLKGKSKDEESRIQRFTQLPWEVFLGIEAFNDGVSSWEETARDLNQVRDLIGLNSQKKHQTQIDEVEFI